MRSDQFDKPRLSSWSGGELLISRRALIELMQGVLFKGVPFRFCTRGCSMMPFLRDLDVITISPLGDGLPRVGDVVAFIHPIENNIMVHRVLSIIGTNLLIQGDSNQAYPDGLIPYQRVLGLVTSVERQGKLVKLGLGPERYLIAWLSRQRLLISLRNLLASFKALFLNGPVSK